MSSKPETTFYTSVHRHLPPASQLHREKMSNPYRGGTADHWYSGAAADLWIEWKFIKLPVRDATPIDLAKLLSPLQQDWLRCRHAEGRHVWVGVGCKEGGALLKRGEWEHPFPTQWFRHRLRTRQELAAEILHHLQGSP